MARELTPEEQFCLMGCRSYTQYYQMRTAYEDGVCIFCNLDREKNRVLFEDEHVYAWMVPEAYMRSTLARHYLVVPKRHVRFLTDLSDDEWRSVHAALKYLYETHGFAGGVTHVREGDMRKNAGTVPHLHINVFEPNEMGEVRIPVYKDPGDLAKNAARASAFAAMYEDGVTPDENE